MSEPRRWAPRAQVDNITVTIDRVWVSWKTLFTAAAKQSAAASHVITVRSCSLQINLWKLFGLASHGNTPAPPFFCVCVFWVHTMFLGCTETSSFASRFRKRLLHLIHQRSKYNPKQHCLYLDWKQFTDWKGFWSTNCLCADFLKRLSLNKRIEKTSYDLLRAKREDGFNKEITLVVHLWQACHCNQSWIFLFQGLFKGPFHCTYLNTVLLPFDL